MSKLPLQFSLKAAAPFAVTPAGACLTPGESAQLSVSFDPGYRRDLVSHMARCRAAISYPAPENAQKDWLELAGVMEFPNLVFDAGAVNFGCVLVDSMQRVSVGVRNPGRVPVSYSWSWLRQDGADQGEALRWLSACSMLGACSTALTSAATCTCRRRGRRHVASEHQPRAQAAGIAAV